MGLIMKKDDSEDNEYIDGIEVVGLSLIHI